MSEIKGNKKIVGKINAKTLRATANIPEWLQPLIINENGVYVGTEPPTDPEKLVWINPDGEASEGYYTIDEINEMLEEYAKKDIVPTIYVKDASITDDILNIIKSDGTSLSFAGGSATSPTIDVAEVENGYKLTITDITGTKEVIISNGEQGPQGIQGLPGKDGKDGLPGQPGADGQPGKDGKNGKDGKDGLPGQPGADGFSPIATVESNSEGAVISITDKNGTTTSQIYNGSNGLPGADGLDGKDGFSPTIEVTDTETGVLLTITDSTGTKTATVNDGVAGPQGVPGEPGHTPVKGVDYFTESEINDIITEAASAVNVPVATTETAGKVKPDGTTITVDADGTIHSAGGGGGGLDSIVAGSGDSAILFNYKAGENDEQIYGEGEIDSQNRGTHQATGKYSTAIGYLTKATGNYSFAGGSPNIVNWGNGSISYRIPQATGDTSFAFGWGDTRATGSCSVAMGYSAKASKEASFCLSHQGFCSGNHSFAINTTPQVFHSDCLVGGYLCKSTNNEQFVFGKFNAKNPSDVEYKMILGNGTSNTTELSKNIMTVDIEGNATFAGTVSSAGADYAEFFEWADGNTEAEDRVGYIVTLDGDKIKLASDGDDILGVISATATVLGDNAEWCWNKRYLTDDFGRTLYEEREITHEAIYNPDGELIQEEKTEVVNAPIINPAYDPNKPYINRRNRPEWSAVGMMGKLYVRDDGTAQVNGYVTAKDGIATHSDSKTNMRVMKRVKDNIILVCLK